MCRLKRRHGRPLDPMSSPCIHISEKTLITFAAISYVDVAPVCLTIHLRLGGFPAIIHHFHSFESTLAKSFITSSVASRTSIHNRFSFNARPCLHLRTTLVSVP